MSRTELGDLTTESGSDAEAGYEIRTTLELVELMNGEDATVARSVAAAAGAIALAADAISERMRRGGRLIYVGAGSSGRIAAVDAAECESTFSTEPGQVYALVAGGASATPLEQEAAEDDGDAGARELLALGLRADDCVVGVSASGRTPYVLGALAAARERGALTSCVVCVEQSLLAPLSDHEVCVVVGPEFLAGSTRLKAGTAQKLVLNTISTVSMIRLGKTYGNLMVDVNATNEKLSARVRRIVGAATGAGGDAIEEALSESGGDAKVAIVALLTGTGPEAARAALARSAGSIRKAVREQSP